MTIHSVNELVTEQQQEYADQIARAARESIHPGRSCWCGGRVQVGGDNVVCLDSEFHDPLATGRPERVSKLYVAGPMSGYEDCNYPAFNDAARWLRDAGYDVVNPAEVHLERCHYVDLIREDLRVMLDCQGVAVIDGWWESAGARNEVSVAGILRMPVRTTAEWLARASQELSA